MTVFPSAQVSRFKRGTTSLPFLYCAIFLFTVLVGMTYQDIPQLDYTHTLLINCCVYASLGCYVLHNYHCVWSTLFVFLQSLACIVYVLMIFTFLYSEQSSYDLLMSYFVVTNYCLILLDVVALLGMSLNGE